ncbi:hypothetical protein [Ruminococcus gauvreauii]|uniref:Uncharacterized protein n=1 Tax=Ruminococcus gauvreauii TaxID=438033 RepID=A0ABY5VI73_9FIRM|nr:hypothetical protein [Ruminococcus gauvreauii]UWP59238.1 hypothetical protein NQ502_18035 [Ruminococcus gauvreauii]
MTALSAVRSNCVAVPLLRSGLYLAGHGLKNKYPCGLLAFLRTWYTLETDKERN